MDNHSDKNESINEKSVKSETTSDVAGTSQSRNGLPFDRHISQIELLKVQGSTDSLENGGRWKPFQDIRYTSENPSFD